MAQEALRRHVLRLLRVWRSWFIFADDFLNGLQVQRFKPVSQAAPQGDLLPSSAPSAARGAQATFLRGPGGGGAPGGALAAELDALPQEALETRCRRSGVSRRGGRADMVRPARAALLCARPGARTRGRAG